MTKLFQCWTFHAGPSVFLPGEGSRKQQDADTIALIISIPMYGLRTRVGAPWECIVYLLITGCIYQLLAVKLLRLLNGILPYDLPVTGFV